MVRVLTGSEPWIIDFEVNSMVKKADPENVVKVSSWDDSLTEELVCGFFGKPLVVCRTSDFPTSDTFIGVLRNGCDGDLVVITDKFNKNTTSYKVASEKRLIETFNKPEMARACRFVTKEVAQYGKQISSSAAEALLNRMAYYDDDDVSLYSVANEIKSICYAVDTDEITTEDVHRLCKENVVSKAYEILSALADHNTELAYKRYQSVLASAPEVVVLSTIFTQIKNAYKLTLFKSDLDAVKRSKVNSYSVSFLTSRNLPAEKLQEMLNVTLEAIDSIKNGADTSLSVLSCFGRLTMLLE